MNQPPPPPPPPHGEAPKSSGLPPGNYDIFIIPPHSSGSGFLYLPSLKPNRNSFVAGFACAMALFTIWMTIAPAIKATWYNVKASGGGSTVVLVIVVAGAVWAVARQQNDTGPGPGGGGNTGPGGGSPPNGHAFPNSYANGAAPAAGPPPQAQQPPPRGGYANGSAGGSGAERPKPTWQRANPASGANANATAGGAAKGAWEKARDETKRKEEERKAKEAEQKRKDDLEKRLREAREKEGRERLEREKRQRDQRGKDQQERETREMREKAEAASRSAGSSYAFSAMGERTNPWPQGRPPATRSQPNSPTKRPPAPTARTYRENDDDAYSYRPYDTPKKPAHKTAPSIYSESSYAPSQSTSRTTPPPSQRGAYHTKDPDKIVIKAVYSFNNSFLKSPTSQLISGAGSVTDGLILRITTEGLFIDDDVRGVPQREWDVKAWTLKLVEVWCPSFRRYLDASASARVASASPSAARISMRRLWGLDSSNSSKDMAAPSSEEFNYFLTSLLQTCRDSCHSLASGTSSVTSATLSTSSQIKTSAYTAGSASSTSASPLSSKDSNIKTKRAPTDKSSLRFQTGENKAAGLHLLRASIRDQDGKRYVFVITEEESWKVAVGLQRLRKGTQVRALGLSGMTVGDARGTLESLGWI